MSEWKGRLLALRQSLLPKNRMWLVEAHLIMSRKISVFCGSPRLRENTAIIQEVVQTEYHQANVPSLDPGANTSVGIIQSLKRFSSSLGRRQRMLSS